MQKFRKLARHDAIKAAAYSVLADKGYAGASMLNIAKAANASNQTLYRWYGNKKGLFAQLVKDNAAETKCMLDIAIAGQLDAIKTLESVAPVFLAMLLGERAILLNRAAAAEPTGELGLAISMGGRDVIQPLFESIMQTPAKEHGIDAKELTRLFLGLLVGDLQIKRVIGVEREPSKADIDERSMAALNTFTKLLASPLK